MSRSLSTFEPELQGGTPRNVKPRTRTEVIRWTWISLLVVLPSGLLLFSRGSQSDFEAMRHHGVKQVATAISKTPRQSGIKNKRSAFASYQYTVDGKMYTTDYPLEDDEYQRFQLGAKREIVYLPEKPEAAYSIEEYSKSGDVGSGARALQLLAGLAALVLLGILAWSEMTRARLRNLAVNGIPFHPDSVKLVDASSKEDGSEWVLQYHFRHEGSNLDGGGPIPRDTAIALNRSGQPVTVLRDPTNSKQHEFYFNVRRAFEIQPSPPLRATVVGPAGNGGKRA